MEQKAQRRHWGCARVQAYSEEGDHIETSGPHLEVNDSCTVCKCFVWMPQVCLISKRFRKKSLFDISDFLAGQYRTVLINYVATLDITVLWARMWKAAATLQHNLQIQMFALCLWILTLNLVKQHYLFFSKWFIYTSPQFATGTGPRLIWRSFKSDPRERQAHRPQRFQRQ